MSFFVATLAWLGTAARLFQFSSQFELPQLVVPHALENLRYRAEGFAPRTIEAVALLGARFHKTRVAPGDRPIRAAIWSKGMCSRLRRMNTSR